ncbi:MAG: hypothetical protein K0U78_01780 [Actinomycetia bacterium]|nr:hypothetical protein [Actinomycetes bacterium]
MAQRIRSYAAAGAAVAVAGAVAVAPAPAQSVPERALAVASPAFALTTTANPIEAWIETFQNSYASFLALTGEYFEAPFPVAQQVLVNWAGYVELLPDIPAIVDDISKNVDALEANLVAAQPDNLDALHQLMFNAVGGLVPPGLLPLIDYTTNYNSGMVVGALGLVVSPLLALGTQIDEFVTELGNGEIIKAANALINIPAAMTDAFFTGHGVLDLNFLIPLIPPQQGLEITELGIAMGGLFSPAGSMFNSLDLKVKFGALPISIPGVKAGLLGSWFAANQSSAEAIGWSGEGNPLAALGKTGAEEEAEEEAAAPAAASAALPAADAVPPSVVDPEAAALTVDLVSDVADADEESDVVDADEESDVVDADEESDVADADEESDVADADVESDVADADEESDVVDADVESDVADGDESTEDSDAAEASDSDDADSDSGADSDSDSGADSDGDSGADSDSSAA